ncbi:MAG: SPOR domain-containing protein [Gemmatimonadota bacterium]
MRAPAQRLFAPTLACLALAGCAAATSGGAGGGRTEEAVPTHAPGPRPAAPLSEPRDGAPAAEAPLRDARAVHGTIDPATGRRTEEPALEGRLREPRRAELQAGRIRQAAAEYEPSGGELPYGYRVQVVASPDFATASRQAAQVNELLGGRLPVYVELIEPFYKVRVGDFASQEAAQPALSELRSLGFPDAWAVRTTIKQAAP